MINIFSFHPLHFVNTTCIISNQEFWKCRNWIHPQNPPAENCFWTEPGEETNCSWMCLTTRWMRPTSSPAPQLEVLGWAHHVASHLCIQIAREVLIQCNSCVGKFCSISNIIVSLIFLCTNWFKTASSFLKSHSSVVMMLLLNQSYTTNVSHTLMTSLYLAGAPPEATSMTRAWWGTTATVIQAAGVRCTRVTTHSITWRAVPMATCGGSTSSNWARSPADTATRTTPSMNHSQKIVDSFMHC